MSIHHFVELSPDPGSHQQAKEAKRGRKFGLKDFRHEHPQRKCNFEFSSSQSGGKLENGLYRRWERQ